MQLDYPINEIKKPDCQEYFLAVRLSLIEVKEDKTRDFPYLPLGRFGFVKAIYYFSALFSFKTYILWMSTKVLIKKSFSLIISMISHRFLTIRLEVEHYVTLSTVSLFLPGGLPSKETLIATCELSYLYSYIVLGYSDWQKCEIPKYPDI